MNEIKREASSYQRLEEDSLALEYSALMEERLLAVRNSLQSEIRN